MKTNIRKQSCFLLMFFSGVSLQLYAQDTLKITLPEAETIFLKKNLTLLAQKYNIDIARAQIIQARLYNNPNISLSSAIYNPDAKKWFDVSNATGEYSIALQQLILLAGKRNKQIRLAETNADIAEQQFYDLLRTLNYALRSDFYNLYYLQKSLSVYERQILSLQKLDAGYHQLLQKGVVALKEATRIRSLLYSLKAEQVDLQNQVNDLQANLQLLLQNNKMVYEAIADEKALATIQVLSLQEMIDSAYTHRNDLKAARLAVQYNRQNYTLQKSMAVPDLNLGASFDKRGTYTENASLVNAAIDLPFFNRNQGNIKAAKTAIDQSKVLVDLQTQTVENDVQKAYLKMLNADRMLHTIDPGFKDEFEKLLQGVLENFQKKNISLIEFTDFYDAYRSNVLQLNQLLNARMQAIESLNLSIGKVVLDP
jgi:cobalt-zinc-cadmium efflux system outer membrane protein